jgi:hypothetical protein
MALNEPPKEMQWNDSEAITLHVSPSLLVSLKKLKQQLEETEGAGETQGRCIWLTNQMEAKLIGSAFKPIEARHSGSVQSVSRNQVTEWEWGFVAKNEGLHHLRLNLRADLTPNQRGDSVQSSRHHLTTTST